MTQTRQTSHPLTFLISACKHCVGSAFSFVDGTAAGTSQVPRLQGLRYPPHGHLYLGFGFLAQLTFAAGELRPAIACLKMERYKDYGPLTLGLHGFPCLLGGGFDAGIAAALLGLLVRNLT